MGEVEEEHQAQDANWVAVRSTIHSDYLVSSGVSALQNPFRSVRTTEITVGRGNAPEMNFGNFLKKCVYLISRNRRGPRSRQFARFSRAVKPTLFECY